MHVILLSYMIIWTCPQWNFTGNKICIITLQGMRPIEFIERKNNISDYLTASASLNWDGGDVFVFCK